jgi:hypothetical protein
MLQAHEKEKNQAKRTNQPRMLEPEGCLGKAELAVSLQEQVKKYQGMLSYGEKNPTRPLFREAKCRTR